MEAVDASMLLPDYDYDCDEVWVEGVKALQKLFIMSQESYSNKTKTNIEIEEEERGGGEPLLLPGLPNHLAIQCLARLPPDDYATLRCVCPAWRRTLRPSSMRSLRIILGMQTQRLLLRLSSQQYEEFATQSCWFLFHPSLREVRALPGPPLHKCLARLYHYAIQYEEEEHQDMVLAMDLQHPYYLPQEVSYPKRLLLHMHLPEGSWSVVPPSSSSNSSEHPRNLGWRSLRHCHTKLRRKGVAYAMLDGFLHVAGGAGKFSSSVSSQHERILVGIENSGQRLNMMDRHWESLPNMCRARINAAGFVMDGCFYVLGGYGYNFSPYNGYKDGEFFDPKTGLWILVPFMWPWSIEEDIERRQWEVPNVAVVGNQLFALKHCASSQVLCYDKIHNIWNSVEFAYIPPPPPPRELDQDYPGWEWERREYQFDLVGLSDELWLIISGIRNVGIYVVASKIKLGQLQEWTPLEFKFDTKFRYVKCRTLFNI